jgi:hypothetical protein
VGPVVIAEIMYQPADARREARWCDNTRDEFIELHNLSLTPVALHDPDRPTNTWKLRGVVDYDFPPGASLAGQAFALIVPFDPGDVGRLSAFRTRYVVATEVPIFGPWHDELDNAGGSVELRQPGAGDERLGRSEHPLHSGRARPLREATPAQPPQRHRLLLQRICGADYGNDPSNWVMVSPPPRRELRARGNPAGHYQPAARPDNPP